MAGRKPHSAQHPKALRKTKKRELGVAEGWEGWRKTAINFEMGVRKG